MMRKAFIAINLPEKIKNKLVQYQEKWSELPARWTRKENLHITLEFLGCLTDEEIVEVCQKTKKIAAGKKVFNIHLNRICYAPPNKKSLKLINSSDAQDPMKTGKENSISSNSSLSSSFNLKNNKTPKMIWVVGEKIKEFNISPHITLARIKAWQFKQMEIEERPEINEEIDLKFEVNSIEVMESQPKRGGLEYIVLESIPLKE